MNSHLRRTLKILMVLTGVFLFSHESGALAQGCSLCFGNPAFTPNSPQMQFTNITFSASATWAQGIDRIRFYVTDNTNGQVGNNWWEFATAYCNGATACTRNGTLNYSSPNRPFSLRGNHLVVINAVASQPAFPSQQADCAGTDGMWYDDQSGRNRCWFVWWNAGGQVPQRMTYFQWTGALSMNNVTPGPIANRPGANATFSANAIWDLGVARIDFWVSATAAGDPPWWRFASVSCNNQINCNVQATLFYNDKPTGFSLAGNHLVVVNAILSQPSSPSSSADCAGSDWWGWDGDSGGNRCWFIWTAHPPSHTRVFQWSNAPSVTSSSIPDKIAHDDTRLVTFVGGSVDNNLSSMQVYYANINSGGVWYPIGGAQPCTGGNCTINVNFNTAQVAESSGYFHVVVNVFNQNNLWCSGNLIQTSSGLIDLWYTSWDLPQAGDCGAFSRKTMTILARNVSPVAEIEPICRWPHVTGQAHTIYYSWGSFLQDPTNNWRIAFQSAINNWHGAPTKFYFANSTSGNININLYYSEIVPIAGGQFLPTCVNNQLTGGEVRTNTYYDFLSANFKQMITTHEIGHVHGIGHIPDSQLVLGLMHSNGSHEPEIYYQAQLADIGLVNQLYP